MISPMTPPGTKIVVLIDIPFFKIAAGALFTVREIDLDPITNGFGVRLREITLPLHEIGVEFMFNLASFNLAALPKCLTELLTTVSNELESV